MERRRFLSLIGKAGATIGVSAFGIHADMQAGPTVKSVNWNIDRSSDVCTVTVYGMLSEETSHITPLTARIQCSEGYTVTNTEPVPTGQQTYAQTIVVNPRKIAEDTVEILSVRCGYDE